MFAWKGPSKPAHWNYVTGKHTIFGRVCEGMTVVKNLGMVETANQDRPTENVMIKRAYPVEGWQMRGGTEDDREVSVLKRFDTRDIRKADLNQLAGEGTKCVPLWICNNFLETDVTIHCSVLPHMTLLLLDLMNSTVKPVDFVSLFDSSHIICCSRFSCLLWELAETAWS